MQMIGRRIFFGPIGKVLMSVLILFIFMVIVVLAFMLVVKTYAAPEMTHVEKALMIVFLGALCGFIGWLVATGIRMLWEDE